MVLALAARKLGSSERGAIDIYICYGSSELVFWLTLFLAIKLKVPTPTQRKRHIPQLLYYIVCDAAARFLVPNSTLHLCVRPLQANNIVRTACLTARVHCKWALSVIVDVHSKTHASSGCKSCRLEK